MELTITLKEGIKNYRLGKITEAIKFFEASLIDNEKNELVHESLGICYMEKGEYEKSIKSFLKVLNLNKSNYKSTLSIINLLNYIRPKNNSKNNILSANENILSLNNKIKKKVLDIYKIKKILNSANSFIKKKFINIEYKQTQIFRRNFENLECDRHFKIFNRYQIIPKFCFSCYKIQITTKNVIELIKLYFLFNQNFIKKSNLRKCMIEVRPNIKGNYKGFIYFKNPIDAKDNLNILKEKIQYSNIQTKNIEIKHGCTEFSEKFPDFKIINFEGDQKMTYRENWEKFENIIDNENIRRSKKDTLYVGATLNLFTISDFLIIYNWLNYAKSIGDNSYKKIFKDQLNENYLNDILKTQYDFRNNELQF